MNKSVFSFILLLCPNLVFALGYTPADVGAPQATAYVQFFVALDACIAGAMVEGRDESDCERRSQLSAADYEQEKAFVGQQMAGASTKCSSESSGQILRIFIDEATGRIGGTAKNRLPEGSIPIGTKRCPQA